MQHFYKLKVGYKHRGLQCTKFYILSETEKYVIKNAIKKDLGTAFLTIEMEAITKDKYEQLIRNCAAFNLDDIAATQTKERT